MIAGKPGEFGEHFGVHQVAVKIVVVRLSFELGGKFVPGLFQRQRLEARSRTATQGLAAAEDDLPQRLGPSPRGLAQIPHEHVNNRGGEGHRARFEVEDIGGFEAAGNEEHGHVPDDFAAGCDFDNVAEESVDAGIGAGDFGPSLAQAHAGGLLFEVGELAAGHFVVIDLRRAAARGGVKGRVRGGGVFPVFGEFVQGRQVQPRVARGVSQGGDDGIEVGLAGRTAHGGDGQIGDIDPRLAGFEDRRGVDAAGVVRVKMDGQARFFLERPDQRVRRKGPAQARHVLDAQEMRSHPLQLPGQTHVIIEGILGPLRIEYVAGVTDGGLANSRGVPHGLHRHLEVGRVIERIEDAEDVNAAGRRVAHESRHDVVRVIGVTDGIGAAEEHLKADVGNPFPQQAQTVPRVLMQEPHGGVEGGPAPHFQAEQLRRPPGNGGGGGQHVERSHTSGQQRLVGVAKGGVGDQQPLLAKRPGGEFLRPHFQQQLPRPRRRRYLVVVSGRRHRRERRLQFDPFDLRIAVDDDVAQEGQQLAGAVAPRLELEQIRRRVDQCRGGLPGAEDRVGDDVFEEGDIGLDAADAEFAQGAVHALEGQVEGAAVTGDLHQERIVKGGDDRPGVTHPAVQPHAVAARRAVGEDSPVIGRELVFRVLSCDPALNGAADARHLLLRRQMDLRAAQGAPLRDQYLRAHQVHPRDYFGDGVLDLDARVDFDEKPAAPVQVVEELDSAGVVVLDGPGQGHSRLAQVLAHRVVQAAGGGDLDDFLMPALHGAIALMEMRHGAVLVAQYLHFNVLGARDVFLQENRRVAEGAARFALRFVQQMRQVGGTMHHAHPASAPAKGRLDDEGEPDLVSQLERLRAVFDRLVRSGQGGDVILAGQLARRHLVAHQFDDLRARADKDDARPGAGPGKVGVLRQKAVTRMNHIHLLLPGQRQQTGNIQVRAHRALALSDQIRFVRLETMDAQAVFLGVNGHGAQPQLRRGAEDTNGDFIAIGDEQFSGGARLCGWAGSRSGGRRFIRVR